YSTIDVTRHFMENVRHWCTAAHSRLQTASRRRSRVWRQCVALGGDGKQPRGMNSQAQAQDLARELVERRVVGPANASRADRPARMRVARVRCRVGATPPANRNTFGVERLDL